MSEPAVTLLSLTCHAYALDRLVQREELLVVRQADKEEDATPSSPSSDARFVFPEVQDALKSVNQLDPKGTYLVTSCIQRLATRREWSGAHATTRFVALRTDVREHQRG